MNKATVELLKELLRTGLLAALSAVVAFLADIQDPSPVILVSTIILRAIDRGIHESESKHNGLVWF